ncbi:hypothetical protein NXW16_25695 [Bacteroides thetaiotaomicron]|nr:hypothetical protein [Bacteroides thetaiotaomicron]
MEVNRTEKITFRCTALEKAALAEQAARCGISTSEYCRTLALGGRPTRFVHRRVKVVFILWMSMISQTSLP